MSKSILLSIRPKWVAKILNGEKTIEVRKKFPKDYVGWVYIYCTKDKERLVDLRDDSFYCGGSERLNGKVVARFWCDKVEEIKFNDKVVQEKSCLTEDELFDYLFINIPYNEDMHKGYAIHITKLEIFDKPKGISEFRKCYRSKGYSQYQSWYLTKAPQSWCWVEE